MTKLAFKLLIIFIVAISAGIAWVRIRWAVGKNKKEADRLIQNLKDRTYNAGSFADSLSMTIKTIPVSPSFETIQFGQRLNKLPGRQFAGKYMVQYAQFDESNKGIIIGEATITDTVGAGGGHAVTMEMPCWLLVEHDAATNSVSFKSTIPESSDHHYLQEQFAEIIVRECTA